MAYAAVGRRRGTDTSITRDRVLEAAELLIVSGGFAQASVAELAAAADVSRATVFSRFGSKLGVLEALSIRCAGGQQMRAIRDALVMDDPADAVRATITACCDHWDVQGHILLTLKAVSELEPGALRLIDEQRSDQRASIDRLVRRLDKAGRLNGMPRAQATSMLHLVTSVESFMELRRNAGLTLPVTKRVLITMAAGALDLAPAP